MKRFYNESNAQGVEYCFEISTDNRNYNKILLCTPIVSVFRLNVLQPKTRVYSIKCLQSASLYINYIEGRVRVSVERVLHTFL